MWLVLGLLLVLLTSSSVFISPFIGHGYRAQVSWRTNITIGNDVHAKEKKIYISDDYKRKKKALPFSFFFLLLADLTRWSVSMDLYHCSSQRCRWYVLFPVHSDVKPMALVNLILVNHKGFYSRSCKQAHIPQITYCLIKFSKWVCEGKYAMLVVCKIITSNNKIKDYFLLLFSSSPVSSVVVIMLL